MKGALVFVVNPRSANGATLRRFERVRERFARELGPIEVKLTKRPRHATELARAAVRAGARAVIAVGGDGTNNEVVNGFFAEDGSPLTDGSEQSPAFGVVTSGTGGDFRRTFAWTREPLDDLSRLRRFQTRTIDIGRVTVTKDSGAGTCDHFFLNIASFGLSGEVVDVVNHSSKAFGSRLSFMVGSVRSLITFRPKRIRITIDDGESWEDDVATMAVANAQYFGGGMWIAPHAVPDDGYFDCVALCGGPSFWVQHGLKLYSGKHIGLEGVRSERCRTVRAEPARASERVLVEIDGEQPGMLPATFTIVPGAIRLLV